MAGDVSPILHVTDDDPPTLLIHGDQDERVPLLSSENMLKTLQEKKVVSELIVIEGGNHNFRVPSHRARADRETIKWFKKHLLPSES